MATKGTDEKALMVVTAENNAVVGSKDKRRNIDEILGNSSPMENLVEMIIRVAPSALSILITGESGVGKQVVAEAIHTSSGRKGPFIDTHCAAFSPTLLEDELFGHEKGAFTGAIGTKKGIFEKANGGTLFLDEIGEIDLSVQVKLLKVLEEKRFTPLGSDREIKSDFRLVSATNRDLKKEVKEGRFREDLYYRINKMNIEVPPLRERKSDITTLASSFLNKYSKENGKFMKGFTDRAFAALLSYKWPGNIRELQNVIEACVVLSKGEYIDLEDLPPYLREITFEGQSKDATPFVPMEDEGIISYDMNVKGIEPQTIDSGSHYVSIKLGTLKEMERDLIKATLDYYGGNKTRAAEALGINRKTLANNSN